MNEAPDYSRDRIYEAVEGGIVVAPDLPMSINRNLFSRRAKRGQAQKDKDWNPVKIPYFKPVCIDGQLMAALSNTPRVTVEEL